MNYKEVLLQSLNMVNDEDSNNYMLKAKELVKEFLIVRYDVEKTNDKFVAEKNLSLLNYYVEEFYFLSNKKTDGNLAIRKNMRHINHFLRNIFNAYV